jgi:hypothetical protein
MNDYRGFYIRIYVRKIKLNLRMKTLFLRIAVAEPD